MYEFLNYKIFCFVKNMLETDFFCQINSEICENLDLGKMKSNLQAYQFLLWCSEYFLEY